MTEPVYETTTERLYARLPDVLRSADRTVDYHLKTFLSALGDIQSDVDLLHARFNYLHPEDRVGPDDLVQPNTTYSYPERVRSLNSEGFLKDQVVGTRKNLLRDPLFKKSAFAISGGGAVDWEYIEEGGPEDIGYIEAVLTATTTASPLSCYLTRANTAYNVSVKPSTTYRLTYWVYQRTSTDTVSRGHYTSGVNYNASMVGTNMGTIESVNLPNGKWVRRSVQFTTLPDTTSVRLNASFTGPADDPIGTVYRVSAGILEENGAAFPTFFYGDSEYENEVEFEAAWDGADDDSSSTETHYQVQERVLNGMRSDLVDARYADEAWLPWIAQLLGADITHLKDEEEVRNLLTSPAVFEAGSYNSIYNAVKSQLSGTQYMRLYRNTVDVLHIGEATEWDILIVTKNSETPAFSQILEAVERNQARPAGVRLYHDTYESSWQAVEAAYPTWAQWEGATWEDIEETGLS